MGLHSHYYKDTRFELAGRLKHGHGGPPVLDCEDLPAIIEHLYSVGIFKKEQLDGFID